MGDYHVHLHPHGPYSGEGPRPGEYPVDHIEAYFEAAHSNGANEVGFTEHFYRCIESKPVLGPFWEADPRKDLRDFTSSYVRSERVLSLERYVQAVVDAKDRGLPVKLGLEVDFFPETVDAVVEFLKPYPFDFLIASTHWLDAWGIDLEPQKYEFERRGLQQAYEDYFLMETRLAASGHFDVLAHADVVKKRGVFLDAPPLDLYEELAVAAGRGGTAVEVSTVGLYQPANEMYPHPELLQRFFNHNVPITLASDAHVPQECGRDRAKAIALARSVGYTQRIEFTKRVGTLVPL
ncbi:MAG: PHP domain-containing protein [Acidimicrobiia bacterium]